MQKLETMDFWSQLLSRVEVESLGALAARYQTTPGLIAAALRRVRSGNATSIEDELPPEAGEERAIPPSRTATKKTRTFAWRIVYHTGNSESTRVVVAPTVVDAAQVAARAGVTAIGVDWVGEIL